MKKESFYLKNYMEISVPKGFGEQIQSLAARQNIDAEQMPEELVRRGLETYLAERAAGAEALVRSKK
ncbi:MAG: hypothetical protein LBH26_00650 [Treponema sp.]|jgi:hypothetical protein|nr:hypothetical protein [Treponema sp.]